MPTFFILLAEKNRMSRLPFGWMKLDSWQKGAVLLWVLILVGSCGRVLLSRSPSSAGIYRVYAEAGQHWREGAAVYPDADGWDAFPYSPLLAAFFVPFSTLSAPLGNALYRLVLSGSFLAALKWWCRSAPPRALSPTGQALVFLLVIPVTATTMVNGQMGGLVAAAVILTIAAAASERWHWAAAFATLGCLIKVYPIALALLLCVCYPRRFAKPFAVALGVGLGLPFLLQSPAYVADQYGRWLHLLRGSDRHDWPLEIANRDVALLFRVWWRPLDRWLWQALQLLTAAGAALWCLAARRAGWPGRRLLVTVLGTATCWMTLFGPVVESFTYILVGPTLAWLLIEAWQEKRAPLYRIGLVASWSIFTAATLAVWFPHAIRVHSMGPHPLAGLLLLGCLLGNDLSRYRAGNRAGEKPSEASSARAA
jgi:hypothetical protein